MTPLQSELHRLFSVATTPADADTVRGLVMELAGPPDWRPLSAVWQGVQAELDLPAPAIAVNGVDAMQLWFSWTQPVPAAQARAFLQALRQRYLPDIDPARVRLHPASGDAVPGQRDDNWSAFVAPDLAPVFGDTPWLDIPPNEEGQAALLRALQPMKPPAFAAALARLGPAQVLSPAGTSDGPRAFLERVMQDETVALALRIEAAKALL